MQLHSLLLDFTTLTWWYDAGLDKAVCLELTPVSQHAHLHFNHLVSCEKKQTQTQMTKTSFDVYMLFTHNLSI